MAFTTKGAIDTLKTLTGWSSGVLGTCYIGLLMNVSTDNSGKLTGWSEPETSKGYRRKVIGNSALQGNNALANPELVGTGATYNPGTITFEEATDDWTTSTNKITHFGLFNSDTPSGGTTDTSLIIWGPLTNQEGVEVKKNYMPLFREYKASASSPQGLYIALQTSELSTATVD